MNSQTNKKITAETKMLFEITAFCASARSNLIGLNFSKEETSEAIKSCGWLLDELQKRTIKK